MGLLIFFSISMTSPLFPSYPLNKNLERLYLTNAAKLLLLKDLPLEKINMASNKDVFPDPLEP